MTEFKPDLFRFSNGEKIENTTQWSSRRKEILDILCQEEYGYSPNPPREVTGTVTGREERCCSGHAVLEQLELSFQAEKGSFSFPVSFFVPKLSHPAPLIVLLNFRPNAYDMFFPAEEIIDHGFALAVICYTDITADNADFNDGLAALYSRTGNGSDWGKIGMWAFAASRAIDYLSRRKEIDSNNIAVAGHSRLGKTALWCAAQDERVRFVCSNDSGCSGAAYERTKHEKAETVDFITKTFPFWFCENYRNHAGKAEQMPFDQHFLLAAVAPRYLCVGSASLDDWADPYSEQLCCVAASPVWKLFGKQGFVGGEQPAKVGDFFSDGDISYHLRDGVHFLGRQDWLNYMQFISSRLK